MMVLIAMALRVVGCVQWRLLVAGGDCCICGGACRGRSGSGSVSCIVGSCV